MSSTDIKKSSASDHKYTNREKEQALEDYREFTVEQVNHVYKLYDKFLKQVEHKNFKSDKYDFELHNQLSFDIEQVKRIVKHKASSVRENYDTKIEDVDFDILLENYQANK